MLSPGYPLGESSGNLQSLVVVSSDGVENQAPCRKQEPHFPIPAVKLGSNDSIDHGIDKEIKAEKPRTFRPKVPYDPKRPFLQHPKYIDYMGRQRQEFGKDGKPVWSDEVEAAFQDGRVSVQARGRLLTSLQHSLISHRWGGRNTLNTAGYLDEICSLQNGFSRPLVRRGNANRFQAIFKSLIVSSKVFLNVNNSSTIRPLEVNILS
jgi:hypothetical protein